MLRRVSAIGLVLFAAVITVAACSSQSSQPTAKKPNVVAKKPAKKAEKKAASKVKQEQAAKKAAEPQLQKAEFTVKTSDGVIIYGTLYEHKGQNAPLVVMVHQLRKDRHEYEKTGIAKAFFDAGYHVLLIDARGHGQSTKTASGEITWQKMGKADWEVAYRDIEAAVEWARASKKLQYVGLGLVGASIGSTTVLLYAQHHPEVKALIMLSPGLAWRDVDTKKPMSLIAGRPVLLVASTKDSGGYCKQTVEELAKLNPKAETLIYDGTKHGVYMTEENPQLIGKLVEWFKKVLPPKH